MLGYDRQGGRSNPTYDLSFVTSLAPLRARDSGFPRRELLLRLGPRFPTDCIKLGMPERSRHHHCSTDNKRDYGFLGHFLETLVKCIAKKLSYAGRY
jgi:hypothetical protein